ncbi:winged helix-turn-helix domain-containing protein [Aliikangiella coralliicola]|uniref:OmpR/PhoB-type domain-containing protein n=1 Tax=Aliikangiella coralliicola TaxID=2592383 RepID=A0A545UJD8_9GAMM|nr:winged helix-turn-helix domain-containing protein [Aliikangiella coralliicola]TQV89575.1 hypothetical protein FLL46_01435 [Aliikangiella coralliicola]
MNEFFVGQFRVDMGRSQIVAQDAIVSMEPRVLQVLLILAEQQGQVLTHQQILDKVWKDVKVAPNTLQRCIAQLRKALGDDAKRQNVIKTHPKVGYSLIVDVVWQAHLTEAQKKEAQKKVTSTPGEPIEKTQSTRKFLMAGMVAIVLLISLATIWTNQPGHSSLPLVKLTALTTTDKKEFSPTYSPDGRFVAFQRYVGLCENELWAKDLVDNREYLLTKHSGIYGTPSWSPNGQSLAFSNVTHCSQASDFQGCKDIRILSFALAKSEPQDARILMACDKQDFSAAVWLDDDNIAFLGKEGVEQQLLRMNLPEKKIEQLYESKNVNFVSLSYSPAQRKLAVTQHDSSLKSSMMLFDIDTQEVFQIPFKPPGNFAGILAWNTNWHPTEPRLITAKRNSMFEVDLNGEFTEYPVPTMQSISDPMFHPDGQSIIASMGLFDKDVKLLQWYDKINGEMLDVETPYQSETLHRSIVIDRDAKFQPVGNGIAYISQSNGSQQIWLATVRKNSLKPIGQPKQLSQLSGSSLIYSFVWSYDGHLIVAVVDGKLKLINLDGQITSLETDYSILNIYQAPAEDKVLLDVFKDKRKQIILLDLKTMDSEVLFEGQVRWAQLSESGKLYIASSNDTVSQVVNGRLIPLQGISDIRVTSRFLYQAQKLVLTARDNSIWIFDLNTHSKEKLFKIVDVLKHIDSVDLKTQRMLVTTVASVKKEIVLFHR